jgi:peptidoglycan/xylan/chitin deacetylase (PgdA/CDA1 family)
MEAMAGLSAGAIGRSNTRHPLERLLMPVQPLGLIDTPAMLDRRDVPGPVVVCASGTGTPEWLTADGWRLYARVSAYAHPGEPVERFLAASGAIAQAVKTGSGEVHVPFSIAEAYKNYVNERWRLGSQMRSLPAWALEAFYRVKRLIPRTAQLAGRRALIRWQGHPKFPAWPFDESVRSLLRFTIRCALASREHDALAFRWFWPEGARAAAILTHDVESAAGLRNAVTIADLEEERGLRSSFNIVGQWYPIDAGVIEELRGRGFELGVHGVYHDRSLFSSREEFERQLPLLRLAAEHLGAEGFRSPATHRVNDWIPELPFSYDCTVPLSDPYEPQPGGCCSPWPFFNGPLVELPYTLPQDYTLFTLLGRSTTALWTDQVQRLERSNGLIQCLSHPDPGYLADLRNRARYRELLDFLVARESLWVALPRDVARWWRERDSGTGQPPASELGWARVEDDGDVDLKASTAGHGR